MMTQKEKFAAMYRRESNILHPLQLGQGNLLEPVIEGDLQNLFAHRLRLTGELDGEWKGHYSYNDKWSTAEVPTYELMLKELAGDFRNHQQMELNQGNQLSKEYPKELLAKREQLEAKLLVFDEEVKFLDKLIVSAQTSKKEADEKREPVLGKKSTWNRQEQRNGVLTSVAGQVVKPDEDGILRISDPRSPYNTLLVYRWRGEVVRPLNREFSWRTRQEMKKVPDDRKKVHYPAAPTYDRKTDKISYEGYAPGPLKKQKLI